MDNVGIGTTNPAQPLHIVKSGAYAIQIDDTTAQAAGVGAGILFRAKYTDVGTYANAAAILPEKTNADSDDQKFDLAFLTRK